MAKIHFVDHSGETRIIDVENGATVMEAAIRNAIPGIEAECGGACACATCASPRKAPTRILETSRCAFSRNWNRPNR